jgi:transcription termination/antitermination protein NusA
VSKELLEGVKLVEKEKGIEAETLLAAIEDSLLAAYRKMPDAKHPVRVDLDRETGDYAVWSVTPEAWDGYLEAHPHHIVPEPEPVAEVPFGEPEHPVEEVEEPEIDWTWFSPEQMIEVTPEGFSRIAGQTAKQVLRQRIQEAERSMMYDEYADRVGEIVTGIVQQDDNRYAFVDLGRMEAILPGSEKVPGERYEQGSRIKAVIIEVRSEGKGPQVVLSRRSDELIRGLFELEVPEIADGLVVIRAVAREAGYRSKIAVESRVQGVDPVGACVGPRGSRVRMVVSELRGEKIDIIPWNDEPARFVAKALAPAKVREVYVDDEARQATVVVPDGELSLAIGKEGLNARLAHRLTGWRIDIVSETEYYAEEVEPVFSGAEGEEDEFPGRCVAVMSTGKRCPNQALDGSRYCGVPAHRELAAKEEGAAAS